MTKTEFFDKLKMDFFLARQMNLKNFLKYNKIELPEEYGMTADDITHWNQEKKEYLTAQSEDLRGVRESHIKTLVSWVEQLSVVNDIVDELLINEQLDSRELVNLVRTIEAAYELQKTLMTDLEINTFIDNSYSENQQAVVDLLRETLAIKGDKQ